MATPTVAAAQQQVLVDATRVSRRLYVGSLPPTGRALHRAGFDVLVLCALPDEYALPSVYGARGQELYARFEASPERGPGGREGIYVIGCPLDDSNDRTPDPSSLRRADEVARAVAAEVRDGRRALLTCAQGRNRSAFVAALALHYLTGRSGRDCARKVRLERERRLGLPVLCNDWFNRVLDSIREGEGWSASPSRLRRILDRSAETRGSAP